MARSRRLLVGRAALAALLLAACGSHGASPGDGAGDGPGGGGGEDGGSPIDAPAPPPGMFPLHVSSDGRYLMTDDGKPFYLHGEAAWSLIVQLASADAEYYLNDRRGRGVNAVLVNLIEHYYANNAPANISNVAPFTKAGDFSTPNEAYFAHADHVIDLAASLGMVVLLTPAYLGFNGGSEGWFQDMSHMGIAKCQQYGDFVGRRYANRHHIIWVWGGDYTPHGMADVAGENCMKAIADHIQAAQPSALRTGHWNFDSTSRDEAMFASSIDLVGVYTYESTDGLTNPILQMCQTARKDPPQPSFLFETCYQNETYHKCDPTSREARRRQWWGLLGCGAGEISGDNPIWNFNAVIASQLQWKTELASTLSNSQARLRSIAQSVNWSSLAPVSAMISTTTGGDNLYLAIAAARTADRKQALIYIPPVIAPDKPPGVTAITVDLSSMAGAVTATWLDPTADASMPAGAGLTGSLPLANPGPNLAGDNDWVLLLRVP